MAPSASQDDLRAEIRRVERGAGVGWHRIVTVFEDAGGARLSHAELAAAVHPLMVGQGLDNPGWWGQGATVAYEKQIGRRATGQSSGGDFQVAASRTLEVAAVVTDGDAGVCGVRDVVGALVSGEGTSLRPVGEPRVSDTPKRSYWRSALDDGTSFEVAVAPKDAAARRVVVTLTVTGMASAGQREDVRSVLKEVLASV